MFNFAWFKSSKDEAPQNTWNADTLTMEQPSSPAAPVQQQQQQQQVVTDQPVRRTRVLIFPWEMRCDRLR